MHTLAKVMLILGALTTVAGIVLFAGGSVAVDSAIDPINDAEWEGTTGTFDGSYDNYYQVYSEAPSCESLTYTINDVNGDTSTYDWECDDGMYNESGYISIGSLSGYGPYSIESSEKLYISDSFEDVGEVVGGFFAILASWGVMCCGGFMFVLGGIFALTLKEPGVVMVGPGGMPLQQNQMMGAQYPQPVQSQQYAQQPVQSQQYAQQPVQQQPVQQSPFGQPSVQQQPVQQSPFGQPPAQQSPFDQQPPQGGF